MMRAPDTKDTAVHSGIFSEAHWQEVEKSLAGVNVYLSTDTLRSAVEDRAYVCTLIYEMKNPLTPKQTADHLRAEVATLEKALAILDPNKGGPVPADWDWLKKRLDTRIARRRSLQAALLEEIAERRECIAENEAKGSSSHQSARTVRNDYWRLLATQWLSFTGGRVSKHQRKHLLNFLHACSQPLLPKLIEEGQKFRPAEFEHELERLLSNFVGNFLRRYARIADQQNL